MSNQNADGALNCGGCVFCDATAAEVTESWHFCPSCGSRLRGPCPSCEGEESPALANFCVSCGQSFDRSQE